MIDLRQLKKRIQVDFADIIEDISIYQINEMRIFLIDETFVDIWFSLKLLGRYSYHWERRFKDGTIFRHDNVPHNKWKNVKTFPKHFHNETPEEVIESYIDDEIEKGTIEFLYFIREKIKNPKNIK